VKATIVLLTYTSAERFQQRMKELNQWTRGYEAEILPVLNGVRDSGYGLALALILSDPAFDALIRPLALPENRGFAGGMNAGAALAQGEIIILLSDDVVVRGDFIGPISDALAHQPSAVVCKHVNDAPSGWNIFGDLVVPYPDGFLLAFRRGTWDALCGFDENFTPAGFEDVDLGYRARQMGFPFVALPTIPVDHPQPGRTSPYDKERFDRCVRMKALFALKHGLVNKPEVP
jgi:GT2 family glycosyltransferase